MKKTISIYMLIYGLITVFSTYPSANFQPKAPIDEAKAENLQILSSKIHQCKAVLQTEGLNSLRKAAEEQKLRDLQEAFRKIIKN